MTEKNTVVYKVDDEDTLDKFCEMICSQNIKSLKKLRYCIQQDLDKQGIEECKGLNRFFEAHAQLLALYLDGDFKLGQAESSGIGFAGFI